MKQIYKYFATIAVALFTSLSSFGYDVCVDGIYYDLIAKAHEATVVSGDNKYSGDIVIPSTIKVEGVDYNVTSIGAYTFSNDNYLTSISIPNSVTSIGEGAFYGCSGLTSISIPNSVTIIDYGAFSGCSSLTSISIPNSVTSIGSTAFYNCTSLTSISLPNSVTSIARFTFQNCSGLTSISIPNSVTSIDYGAFSGCSSLTSITIPNSVTSIGEGAFYGCSGLTSVSIPNSVTYIDNYAFSGCTSLTSISIPNSVTYISQYAFYGCSGLTSISIPNSVTIIDLGAFSGCSSLTSISIPNSVTSIGSIAFQRCTSLTSISIGNSVGEIYSGAFSNCKNLEEMTCYAEKVPWMSSGVFTDSYVGYATLKVPEASVAAYKAADQWKDFGKILGLNGGSPEANKCSTPSIRFENNKLVYSTDTDGADIVSEVTVADAKKSYDKEVALTGVYEITAYATKSGWNDSEAATATLVWLNGSLTGTSNNSKIEVDAKPVLISSANGAITVTGLSDGDKVELYSADGKLMSTTTAMGVTATCIADSGINIVKIGNKRVKVMVK